MLMKFICEKCGTTYSRETYTSASTKSTKNFWREREGTAYGICPECYKEQKILEKERANEAAAQEAIERNLPELEGTEKQVAWANTLRQKRIESIENHIDSLQELMESSKFPNHITNIKNAIEKFGKMLAVVCRKGKSSWFIDNRQLSLDMLYDTMESEIDSFVSVEEPESEVENVEDVEAEATVYPENPETSGVTEIKLLDNKIEAVFEKNDKFRELVKSLGYAWGNGYWHRKITETTGTVIDRAAELGNKLLNAGFPIRIMDGEVRQKAIDGVYEQECKRWIYHRVSGDYAGWFAINWDGKDDRLYNVARKLPGSKWSKPSVVVKAEHFQEIQEFANLYGFKFTKAALDALEAAKAIKESAQVIKPVKVEEVQIEDGLKEILKSGDEIIDDLKD